MNKILNLIIILLLVGVLSGCHQCVDRIDANPNYIEDFAIEYGLIDYSIDGINFQDAEVIGDQVTDTRCSVTPEQHHTVLVEHLNETLKILVVTSCESDEIYFYETNFISVEMINSIIEHYNTAHDGVINVGEEENYINDRSHYQYVDAARNGLASLVTYTVGSIRYGTHWSFVSLVKLSEISYQLRTNVIYNNDYESEVLLEFRIVDGEVDYLG